MRFHAHSYLAFVLTPEPPIFDWLAHLDSWLERSPGFFVGRPVVLNLAGTELSASAIAHLVANLDERKIRILGLEGVDPAVVGPELPPLLRGGRPASTAPLLEVPAPVKAPAAPAVSAKAVSSLLIEDPVRSGQSIVFTEGDVTVLGSV